MLLPLFISVRDLFDAGEEPRRYSVFLPMADVLRTLDEAEAAGDPEDVSRLKALLRDMAEKQGVALDPEEPLHYGYAAIGGFWFQNAPPEIGHRLMPEMLRSMVGNPAPPPRPSLPTPNPAPPAPPPAPWWAFWRR